MFWGICDYEQSVNLEVPIAKCKSKYMFKLDMLGTKRRVMSCINEANILFLTRTYSLNI